MKYFLSIILCLMVSLPALTHSADIDGLYPPMEIEPELLGSPKIEGMVFVKGDCFDMGDTFGDGDSDEKPVHRVCVDDFYMGKYEVTQKEWKDVMGNNPSLFKGGFFGCGRCPVESVSWNDVQEYIKKLSRNTGKNYRLPTDAEWEYAAREGGKRVRFGTGKDTIGADEANFNANASKSYKTSYSRAGEYRKKTMPVGSFFPNALGLYDMSGNVWEWVGDWYDSSYYSKSPLHNPKGPRSGKYRVLRGGSWNNNPEDVRAAYRHWDYPDFRSNSLGFRLSLPPHD